MRRLAPRALAIAVGASPLLVGAVAEANNRRFTYTYGSDTLAPGTAEIEPWTTLRSRREGFYFRVDNRLELEAGLADGVQTAFYFNVTSTTKDEATAAGTVRETETEWKGISWEWKFKVLDNVADPVGLGLYVEPGIGAGEGELEGKLIVDKRAGDVFFAWNLVGEYEAEFETADVEHELALENDLGLAYFVAPSVTIGIEVRNVTHFGLSEGFESSAFFAGPTVSFSRESWWTAMTILPQLGAIKAEEEGEAGEGEAKDSSFDLHDHERLEARLLMGFHL